MSANRTLAKLRGISEETIAEIDALHIQLEKLVSRATNGQFNTSVYNAIKQIENKLQVLWGFGIDPAFHTWKRLYEFRCQWIGRKFKCKNTGEELIIPENVREKDFYPFGDCFVDVGVLNGYSRFGGPVEEIQNVVVEVK